MANKKTPKGQLKIVGTERKEIEKLTDAANSYQQLVAERMEIQAKEADAKAHLISTAQKAIEDGEIEEPPDDGKKHVVYRYEDDEGVTRDVKMKHKWGINVNKSKVNADEEDTEEAA